MPAIATFRRPAPLAAPARSLPVQLALLTLMSLLGAVVLAGCSSSPRVQFHSLMPAPSAAPMPATATATATGAAAASPFAFRIESPVRVPAQVNQPQLVMRTAQGGVVVQEYQRWVAPLTDEWRDALASELARLTGAQDASRMPAAAGVPRWDLRLELQRFDAVPGQQVLHQVAWSVLQPQRAAPALSCSTTLTLPAPGDVAGVVAAHREATRQLARHLGTALQSLQGGAMPTCPESRT